MLLPACEPCPSEVDVEFYRVVDSIPECRLYWVEAATWSLVVKGETLMRGSFTDCLFYSVRLGFADWRGSADFGASSPDLVSA